MSLVDASELSELSQPPDEAPSRADVTVSDSRAEANIGQPAAKAPKSEHEPVTVFHREVAKYVKQSLDKYYFPQVHRRLILSIIIIRILYCLTCGLNLFQEGQPNERRIADGTEYGLLAKGFSHRFRQEEKESYVAHGNEVETIVMTPDIKSRIKDRIDMEMEKKPVLH